jgi:hypothetical protein
MTMPLNYATYAVPRADLREAIMEFDPTTAGFITTEILPIKGVKRKAATLSVMVRENLKRVDTKHANGSAYNRFRTKLEDKAYACENHGLEEPLTDEDRANYDNDFDAELEIAMLCQQRLLIEQEIRTAALIFNTTTWTGSALYTDVSATPWDAAASDAIAHILAAKGKVRVNTGMEPNALVIGAATMDNLLGNTGIKNRFPGAPIITEAMLRTQMASIFGLDKLIVGKRIYDSANEGQTFTGSYIWSDDYAMVCRVNEGSLRAGGLGRTLLWDAYAPDNVMVDQYREEQTKSDIIRVEQYVDEFIMDPYFGHLLKVDA